VLCCRFLIHRTSTYWQVSFTVVCIFCYYAPLCRCALSHTAIRPSVCPSQGTAAPGYRHSCCLQLGYRRPPEMCGLWTRPRMDIDPPRVKQPSAGGIMSCLPGAIACYRSFSYYGSCYYYSCFGMSGLSQSDSPCFLIVKLVNVLI